MKYLVRWHEWTPDDFSARVYNQLAETTHDANHAKVALYHRCYSIFGFERASKFCFYNSVGYDLDGVSEWGASEVVNKQEVTVATFTVTKLEN